MEAGDRFEAVLGARHGAHAGTGLPDDVDAGVSGADADELLAAMAKSHAPAQMVPVAHALGSARADTEPVKRMRSALAGAMARHGMDRVHPSEVLCDDGSAIGREATHKPVLPAKQRTRVLGNTFSAVWPDYASDHAEQLLETLTGSGEQWTTQELSGFATQTAAAAAAEVLAPVLHSGGEGVLARALGGSYGDARRQFRQRRFAPDGRLAGLVLIADWQYALARALPERKFYELRNGLMERLGEETAARAMPHTRLADRRQKLREAEATYPPPYVRL